MESLINKLALGTVQFGLDYGINNPNGKPTKEKSLEILDFAYEKGIKVFDTARVYGDAEETLGEFLQSRNLEEEIKIITKLDLDVFSKSKGKLRDIVAAELEESLKRLKRDYVDGYLLHTPEHIRNDEIVGIMVDLKKQGLVKNIGVSIYEEADAIYAANLKEVDYIQAPYNIFDQRMDRSGFFRLAKKNGKTVFARSAFLQGLFLMPENKIPLLLEKTKVYLSRMDKIIAKYSLARREVALLFSCANKNIDYAVFGVDNIGQLQEHIRTLEGKKDFTGCLEELKNSFSDVEKIITSPNLWKK